MFRSYVQYSSGRKVMQVLFARLKRNVEFVNFPPFINDLASHHIGDFLMLGKFLDCQVIIDEFKIKVADLCAEWFLHIISMAGKLNGASDYLQRGAVCQFSGNLTASCHTVQPIDKRATCVAILRILALAQGATLAGDFFQFRVSVPEFGAKGFLVCDCHIDILARFKWGATNYLSILSMPDR